MRKTLILALIAAIITPAGLSIIAQASKHNTPTVHKSAMGPNMPQPSRINFNPQIPGADRRIPGRIFLESADILSKMSTDTFLVLSGNVHFSRGGMQMYCDSAHYFPASESMDAFSNVRMEQGDTLFIYADELNYRGGSHPVAYLYGNESQQVRMINRNTRLETPTFTYDLFEERGYYNTGGTLTDPFNRLTSDEGEYIPATKEANFYNNVWLHRIDGRDTLDIYTDNLNYNTVTHIAEFYSPTRIVNPRGTIESDAGVYNTLTNQTELLSRSTIHIERGEGRPQTTFTGDTILYDRVQGFGQAFGNVILFDPNRQVTLTGGYGFYDQRSDSAFFTKDALAKEFSRGDTLFIHGRYVRSVRNINTDSLTQRNDTTHTIVAWPRVRFYRSDMQGLCDSMTFVQRDSILHLDRHPVVWSDDRQIFGNKMLLHLNDSILDHALLPDFGFTAQHIEDRYYNQLSGRKMEAWFTGGELSAANVNGSVEAIFYPEENDSTINKLVNLQTANMDATFENRAMIRLKTYPQTDGTVTPLYLAKQSQLLLPKFAWYDELRPDSPVSVLEIPAGMDELMEHEPIPTIPVPSAPDMRMGPFSKPAPHIPVPPPAPLPLPEQ